MDDHTKAIFENGKIEHVGVRVDYDGARKTKMAQYIASITNSGVEFERTAYIIEKGNAKSMDAFYYDDIEEVAHIIEFKTGKEYTRHAAQMAMYVYAVEREFNAVRDGIQIRTHIKYFDNPQHDAVVDIQMESRSITEEFSSRNPKMFAEMYNVVANKTAKKARTQEKYQTEEYIETRNATRRAHNKTEKGIAAIKAFRDGTNGRFSERQQSFNRRAKNKETRRNGGIVVKRKHTISKAVIEAQTEFEKARDSYVSVIY